MRRVACVGDKTTTGGIFVAGSSNWRVKGKEIILHGDSVLCPICKSMGKAVATSGKMMVRGRAAITDGDPVACGCPPGADKVVAASASAYVP